MIKENYINMNLSNEIYNRLENKETVKKNQCYRNAFDNLVEVKYILEDLGYNSENLNIVYCYLQLVDYMPLYCRHCIYAIDNEIIDLTILSYESKKNVDKLKYYPFAKFNIDDYFEFLSENDGDINLTNYKNELEIYKEIVKYDEWFTLIEDEFFRYIMKY